MYNLSSFIHPGNSYNICSLSLIDKEKEHIAAFAK